MYFGEYLIEQKVITDEQLISSLVEQLEKLPSFLRVLRDSSLLDLNTIMSVVAEQASNNSDILTVIRSRQLLSDEQIGQLFLTQVEKRTPLGEILVGQEIVAVDVINDLVDKFHAIKDESSGPKMSAAALESLKELENSGVKQSSPSEPKMSAAALESLKELENPGVKQSTGSEPKMSAAALESLKELEGSGVAQSDLVSTDAAIDFDFSAELSEIFKDQLLSSFNEGSYNKLKKIIKMSIDTASTGGDVGNVINSFYRENHMIKGAVSLAKAEVLNKIVSSCDILATSFFSMEKDNLCSWLGENIHHIEEYVEVIWLLRESIQLNGSEKVFWSNSELKKRYITIYNNIEQLNN